MPRGCPFTELCRHAARLAQPVAADLHAHTRASDGDATPEQLVAYARAARLKSLAVTDHDTTAGIADAVAASRGTGLEIVPGVEVSVEFRGREIHVLGLAIDLGSVELERTLAPVIAGRRQRFREYVAAIPELAPAREAGLDRLVEAGTASPGRRHVATLLVQTGVAASRGEVFRRHLAAVAGRVAAKPLVPLRAAIDAIRGAGGVAVLAHPPPEFGECELRELADAGLDGLETRFPSAGVGRRAELAALAQRFGLLESGGSDFHGLDGERKIGSHGLSAEGWRDLANRANLRTAVSHRIDTFAGSPCGGGTSAP